MNSFTFCKSWQTCVICFCQACNTSTKFSVFTNTFSSKELFVSSKCFSTLTIADSIQITKFFQFFNGKSKVSQDNIFSWNLIQDFQTLFIVITPDIFTINNTSIESLVSWETTFNKFKCLLTFDKVKTNTVNWQVHEIIIDITNITKVCLNQDFKAFLVRQKFIVKIQEKCFFISCQIFNKCWFIKLDTSRTKFSQFSENFLVGSYKTINEVFSFYTIFKVR